MRFLLVLTALALIPQSIALADTRPPATDAQVRQAYYGGAPHHEPAGTRSLNAQSRSHGRNWKICITYPVRGTGVGWHTHPGPVIIQVQQGKLKITQGPCHPNVVGPGETYIETPELPVLATANQAASWTATLIVPAGAPLRTNVSAAC